MATKVIKTTPDVTPGQMATFAIQTDLIAPYRYQWKKDGVFIAGAGSSKSYTTPPLSNADFRAVFSCTVWAQNGIEEATGIALNAAMADPTTISNQGPPKTAWQPYVEPKVDAKEKS